MSKVVYVHRRIDNNKVFYVGMGSKRRPKSKSDRNKYWHNTVKKYGYNVCVLAEGLSTKDALDLEELIIQSYGLDNLTNMTTGGECWTHDLETRKRMSKIQKGKKRSKSSSLKRINTLKKMYGKGSSPKTEDGLKRIKEANVNNNHSGQKVIDRSTGVVYKSLSDACRILGFSRSTIAMQLIGKKRRQDYNKLYKL